MSQSKGRKEITEQSEGFPSPWAMLTFQTHERTLNLTSFLHSKYLRNTGQVSYRPWRDGRTDEAVKDTHTRPLRTRKALQVVRIDSHGLQPQVT